MSAAPSRLAHRPRNAWLVVAMAGALLTLAGSGAPARAGSAAALAAPADSTHAADSTGVAGTGAADSTGAASAPDYIARVRAEFTPENRAYASIQVALGLIAPLVDIVIGLLLLWTGLSARARDLAFSWARRHYLRVLFYFVLFSLATFVLEFPFAWYRGFALEHRFALSTQSFGGWLGEQAKDLLVNVVFLGVLPLLALGYRAIRKSPQRWWLWLTLATLPVIVFAVLVEPIVIDPLYNKFTPLRDQELKAGILALAEKAGIPGRNVYEVDKSHQTVKYNAYVNGFGASQRIVIWDTTLKGMKQDEILFVVGHEMGHYKLGHMWKGIVFSWLLTGGLFFGSWLIMTRAVRRFGARWGFTELHDLASVPLFFACLSLVSMIAEPASNVYTRTIEHEADGFALELTHMNDAGARAFIKLGSQNRSDPEPPALVKLLLFTHPPLVERIRFAIGYHPWADGRPNRFYRPSR
jgi:Zn-dependent protease with chaperone function